MVVQREAGHKANSKVTDAAVLGELGHDFPDVFQSFLKDTACVGS